VSEPITFSADDAVLVIRLIDVVTKRGAIEGSELSAVGQIRARFEALQKGYSTPPAIETVTPPETK
jgi:hypothetical protein